LKGMTFRRSVLLCACSLALLASPTVGSVAFAQEGTVQPEAAPVVQPAQTEENDFPWGVLGLLGLSGLAGLRRREEPRRLETVDASRRG
jgi:MYXO-CTERM domain-containing protein